MSPRGGKGQASLSTSLFAMNTWDSASDGLSPEAANSLFRTEFVWRKTHVPSATARARRDRLAPLIVKPAVE